MRAQLLQLLDAIEQSGGSIQGLREEIGEAMECHRSDAACDYFKYAVGGVPIDRYRAVRDGLWEVPDEEVWRIIQSAKQQLNAMQHRA